MKRKSFYFESELLIKKLDYGIILLIKILILWIEWIDEQKTKKKWTMFKHFKIRIHILMYIILILKYNEKV